MKKTLYILALTSVLLSCNGNAEKQNGKNSTVIQADTMNRNQIAEGDSIFKIGDFLFEAKKNATFEFVKKGDKTKVRTNGDTLYFDNDILLLGDINEITSPCIFKKFKFKSQFKDFKPDNIYKGKLAEPVFSTDPHAKLFITRIKDGCKEEGVNFAGHYTIVEWGCGSACQQMAIVDRISGDIIFSQIPFDTSDGHSGTEFTKDSRMLIINTEAFSEFNDYEPGYICCEQWRWRKPAVFEIKEGRLKQVE